MSYDKWQGGKNGEFFSMNSSNESIEEISF